MAEKASKIVSKSPTSAAKPDKFGPRTPDAGEWGPLISEPATLPEAFLRWIDGRSKRIEFNDLRTEFLNRVRALSALDGPSDDRRMRFIIDQSKGEDVAEDRHYWGHHSFPGDDHYTMALRQFQIDLKNSGFMDLAQGSALHPQSLAAGALAALDRKKFSSRLFDAWFTLGTLLGRQRELESQEASNAAKFIAGKRSAAVSSKDMQKIWLARWLLTNCENFSADRGEQLGLVEELCESISVGQRASPNPKEWPAAWFAALLNKGELVKWVDDSEAKLRALADNKLVPNYLLPPLRLSEHPTSRVKPPPGGG